MKCLKRNGEFRKVSEKNLEDIKSVKNLIAQGWNYCSKSEYKDAMTVEKPTRKEKKTKIKK